MKNLFLLFALTTFQVSLFAQQASSPDSESGSTHKLLAYNTNSNIPNNQAKANHSTHIAKASNTTKQGDSYTKETTKNTSTNSKNENWEMIIETPENSAKRSSLTAEFTLDWPCSIND